MVLDTAKHFVIVRNMLGNGLSSSSSNMPAPYDEEWVCRSIPGGGGQPVDVAFTGSALKDLLAR
jgi:hypothetical protein